MAPSSPAPRMRRIAGCLCALACLVTLAAATPPARAQDADADGQQAVFRSDLQENIDAADQFAEVQDLIDHGRANVAYDTLHRMMEASPDEVVRMSEGARFRYFSGVKQACRDRLRALWSVPAAGGRPSGAEMLARYRDIYDPPARLRFEAARAARDAHELAGVASDYRSTAWSDDALLVLGDLYAEQGNPAEALVSWEELLAHWDEWQDPPLPFEALLARVVSAHLALGHREEAARLVKGWALGLRLVGALASWVLGDGGDLRRSGRTLARDFLARPVQAGGERRPFLAVVRGVSRALARGRATWSGDEWLTLGGGLEPEGFRPPVTELGERAWSARFLDVCNEGDLPSVHGPEKQLAWASPVVEVTDVGVDTRLVQPFHPIVSGGRVYVLNDLRGRVYDLATGATAGSFGDYVISPTGGFTVEDGLVRMPQGLAARGRFLVAVKRASARPGPRGDDIVRRLDQLPEQSVFAYDLAAGLRRLWDTTDVKDEESRDFYLRACFHGPPALDEHSVYVGAYVIENDVRAYLCSIDLRTGRLNWATQLCAEQLSSFAAVNPRPGLAPVKVDGLVVWCSNQGVIGGFDALTGEVRWLLQYPRRMAYKYAGNVDMATGWSDNPPMVSERVLFVTPQDAEWLVSADARTGRPYAVDPRVVEGDADYRYLVPGSHGEVFLLGQRPVTGRPGGRVRSRAAAVVGRVVRFDPRHPGTPGVPLDLPDAITGRGRAVGGVLYCPTRKGLYVADYTDPRTPVLRGPLIAWEDPARTACEAVVLQSSVLIARGDGTLEAYPVKR